VTDSRLELLERSYEAFAASDAEAAVTVWHPDCEWDMGPAGVVSPEAVWRGHDGIRAFFGEVARTADRVDATMLGVRSEGDKLLVRGVNHFSLRDTQAEVSNQPFGQVCEFRDGLLWHVTQTEDPPPGWDDADPVH
jgi:ketosteroid isomerase-like protein